MFDGKKFLKPPNFHISALPHPNTTIVADGDVNKYSDAPQWIKERNELKLGTSVGIVKRGEALKVNEIIGIPDERGPFFWAAVGEE